MLGCGVLDYQRETPLDLALATLELAGRKGGRWRSAAVGSAEVIDLDVGACA